MSVCDVLLHSTVCRLHLPPDRNHDTALPVSRSENPTPRHLPHPLPVSLRAMLQRVWACCCCCCPGSAPTSSGGNNGGSADGRRTGSYTPLANPGGDVVLQLSQSPRTERMNSGLDAIDDDDDAFEIEIDAVAEEEDEEQMASMRALDAGGEIDHDADSARFLREVEMATRNITNGVASLSPLPRTSGRTPVTLLQPPPAYSFPAAVPAVAASVSGGDGSAITSDDLEVGETDADIQRFKRALDRAENAMRAERAARISPPSPAAAAAAAPPVVPAVPAATAALRPESVQLSQNHSAASAATHAPAPGPGPSSASVHAAADTPIRNAVPLIPGPVPSSALPTVRKSKSHTAAAAAHSLPASSAVGQSALLVPPRQSLLVQPVAAAAHANGTTAAKPAVASLSQPDRLAHTPQTHPSVTTDTSSHPAAASHTAHMVHSPSAPSLSAARNAAPFVPALPVAVVEEPPTLAQEDGAPPIAETKATVVAAPAAAIAASSKPAKPAAATVAAATASTASSSPRRKRSAPSGNPLDRLGVPGGVISSAHMEEVMSVLKGGGGGGASGAHGPDLAADVSYAHLFAFLHAVSRTLPGKVVRPFVIPELQAIIAAHKGDKPVLKRSASQSVAPSSALTAAAAAAAHPAPKAAGGVGLEAAKLLLSFMHWLSAIRIDRSGPLGTLTVALEFGKDASGNYAYVDQPSQPTWVLVSKHAKDPWLFHPSNTPKIYRNESHRLCIHKEIVLSFDEKGIKVCAPLRA